MKNNNKYANVGLLGGCSLNKKVLAYTIIIFSVFIVIGFFYGLYFYFLKNPIVKTETHYDKNTCDTVPKFTRDFFAKLKNGKSIKVAELSSNDCFIKIKKTKYVNILEADLVGYASKEKSNLLLNLVLSKESIIVLKNIFYEGVFEVHFRYILQVGYMQEGRVRKIKFSFNKNP